MRFNARSQLKAPVLHRSCSPSSSASVSNKGELVWSQKRDEPTVIGGTEPKNLQISSSELKDLYILVYACYLLSYFNPCLNKEIRGGYLNYTGNNLKELTDIKSFIWKDNFRPSTNGSHYKGNTFDAAFLTYFSGYVHFFKLFFYRKLILVKYLCCNVHQCFHACTSTQNSDIILW